MATAIRAIPTLYGETAKSFECEAKRTEQNPGTQDYRHEAKVVSDYCFSSISSFRCSQLMRQKTDGTSM